MENFLLFWSLDKLPRENLREIAFIVRKILKYFHLILIVIFPNVGPPGPPGKEPPPELKELRKPQIAFYIGLSQNIEQIPPGENCPLIFDTVILNEGGFYNSTTGVFTTKFSGVYSFLLVVSARSYEKVRLMLEIFIF